MQLKLELLEYQETAIKSVVNVFEGSVKNNFDNASFGGIRSNVCSLTSEQISENIKTVLKKNAINDAIAQLTYEQELTIEMETGTGKTLVYIKMIYELCKHYNFTKFIILVPSVAIRQGVLNTLSTFEKQLEDIYGFTPKSFLYNSKKLNKVLHFIEEQHPQIMVMTLASFNSDDKILNQSMREDLFANIPFIDAIGKTNPIVIMDEPQEGMDTENSIKQIEKLNPLFKIRFSATHKISKNKIYRLTPYDSYQQGLVKKIEVLTVTEKNDEAIVKLELAAVRNSENKIQVKIKAWHHSAGGKIEFKNSKWLQDFDNVGEATNNPSYLNYKIERIKKSLKTGKWKVQFANGKEIFEKQLTGNIQGIWDLQLEWLIIRHFTKKQKLQEKGIKCLSLIFIDKVANYIGTEPVIKNLFVEKYKRLYPEYHPNIDRSNVLSAEHIDAIQGFYFAQTGKGEFTDNENTMRKNSTVFDAILKDKGDLLNFGDTVANKIEFIFSHSALGVGWDNPNIFNIATLSNSYSEIKKRQEIGRGLRICVNADGFRVYDDVAVSDKDRINVLTIIPNESYQTFVNQYQDEIKELYGSKNEGAGMTHSHKGEKQNKVSFKPNKIETIDDVFKRFWRTIAKKTNYTTSFDEEALIKRSTVALNKIVITDYIAEVSSHTISAVSENFIKDQLESAKSYNLKTNYTSLDLIQEISQNTGISYITAFTILKNITSDSLVKNPPKFIQQAASIINGIQLEEMRRVLNYNLSVDDIPFDFEEFVQQVSKNNAAVNLNKSFFSRMLVDKLTESQFADGIDLDSDVICLLKLPNYYKIVTPIGIYNPDFAIVMKRELLLNGKESEFYFVIETKRPIYIKDRKALKKNANFIM